MNKAGFLATIAAAVLAGCSAPAQPVESPAAEESPLLPTTFGAEGCLVQLLAFIAEPGPATAVLPPGFHLRDPADFSPAQVSTGKSLVGAFFQDCPSSTLGGDPVRLGGLVVFVQRPEVEPSIDGVRFDFYVPEAWAGPGAPGDLMRQHGWTGPDVRIEADMGPAYPTLPVAQVEARNNGTILLESRAPLPGRLDYGPATMRLWHHDGRLLSHLETNISLETMHVGLAACEYAVGSLLERLVQQPACSAGRPLHYVLAEQDLAAVVRSFPEGSP